MIQGLMALCVSRPEHAQDKSQDKEGEEPLLEALIPPPRAEETPTKEKPKASVNKSLKMADLILSAIGLWLGCTVLGICEVIFEGVSFFAPPMMASGIIFFAGPAPPSPKPFLLGTLGSATLSFGALLLTKDMLPDIAHQGLAAGVLLVWYKATNVLFPPAVVLAGSLMVAFAHVAAPNPDEHPGLKATLYSLAFPWLVGHAWLYAVAMIMSKVRNHVRVSLAAAAFSSAEMSRSNEELKQIFKKFDTSGDGALDAEELKVALRVAIGLDLSDGDCQSMIAQYDKDGTGTVDFHEFLHVCAH